MRIQHNIMAMNAYRNYNTNTSALSKNLEKLSSGYKINRAGDDAAGLAISEKMRAQITGLNTAQKNVKDGISLVKTAEGAMQEVQDMLNRMVDLATQSANGTYQDDVDREALQAEIDQLNSEIDRIADSANFNGIKLLDGSLSATGGKGAATKFVADGTTGFGKLPAIGTVLGSDTVKHNKGADGTTGTSFSVDLHNANITNEAGKVFTIDIGNGVKVTLTGTASSADATNVSASKIVDILTGGSTAASAAGFTLDIAVGSVTGSAAFKFEDGALVIINGAGSKGGDVKLTKGEGGDNRLTFTQMNRPTSTDAQWKPAASVAISFGEAAGTTTSLSNDNLIQTLTAGIVGYSAPVPTLGSSVTLTAGSLAASGTDKTSLASATTGVSKLTAEVTVTASKVLSANVAGSISFAVATLASGSDKTLVLKVGSKVIAKATTAIATIATSGSLVFDFGDYGKITLKAGSAAATKSSIEGISGDKALGGKVAGTPAVKGTLTGDSTELQAAIGTTAPIGDIKLTATGSGSSAAYVIKVGGTTGNTASVAVTVSWASGTSANAGKAIATIKAGSKALATITVAGTKNAASAALLAKAKASGGLKIGENKAVEEPGSGASKGSIASGAFGTTGSSALAAIKGANTVGSTGFFKTEEVATVASVTLTSVIGSAAANVIANLASTTASIGSTGTAALKAASITLGSLTVSLASVAFTASMTGSQALQAIVDKLNAAAAEKAKTDYNALGTTGSITIYHDFKFVNGNGSAVTHAGGPFDGVTLTYKTTTLSTQADQPGDTGATASDFDYNVSTTVLDFVGVDGGDRLASTYFELPQDKVVDGASVKIGNDTYTFSANKANAGKEGIVDIHDLVDENEDGTFTFKSDAHYEQALYRLTVAAKDNEVYTVGYDNNRITVTERTDWNNKTPDVFDLTTKEGIEKSLGYNAAGAAAANGGKGLTLQIGDTSESFNQLNVQIGDIHANALGVGGLSISTQEDAANAINTIKNAINTVSSIRGTLGATQNRLEHTQNNLSVMAENIQDAESSIRDTDIAEEMMAYTKNNILVQSAQAMLAQANQVPQGVLQLLG